MTKYSLETKLAAVHAYLDGVESFQVTAQKHNVNIVMLKKWVAKFREHGLAGLQKGYTDYSIEFKMDVLNYINKTGASILEATTVFNIPSSNTVWMWKELFDTQGIDALQPKKKGRPSMKKKPEKNQPEGSEESLKAEIERLRMENAYLKKLHALIQEKEKSQNKTKRK
ncbi:helix-turn-helix domain-containing protein [Bacillus sp. AFS018417]|uniref:helix-turn-helix domain-containing protein n=1 Tax=Bacillus sp. AFS018417 TaxID=2033491 RepID=UPI0020D1FDC6|nr:helix-turn-helix domain-containing protein [Bacillus sp. AFS018417]